MKNQIKILKNKEKHKLKVSAKSNYQSDHLLEKGMNIWSLSVLLRFILGKSKNLYNLFSIHFVSLRSSDKLSYETFALRFLAIYYA